MAASGTNRLPASQADCCHCTPASDAADASVGKPTLRFRYSSIRSLVREVAGGQWWGSVPILTKVDSTAASRVMLCRWLYETLTGRRRGFPIERSRILEISDILIRIENPNRRELTLRRIVE
jgi:hypothetical protein